MKFKDCKYIGIVGKGEGAAFRDYHVSTANLSFKNPPVLDRGVYAAVTQYNGKDYESIICYGADEEKFEVHLFDFEKEIYGEELCVTIIKKVSEIIPWESRERMRQKIIHDIGLVKDIFSE